MKTQRRLDKQECRVYTQSKWDSQSTAYNYCADVILASDRPCTAVYIYMSGNVRSQLKCFAISCVDSVGSSGF